MDRTNQGDYEKVIARMKDVLSVLGYIVVGLNGERPLGHVLEHSEEVLGREVWIVAQATPEEKATHDKVLGLKRGKAMPFYYKCVSS